MGWFGIQHKGDYLTKSTVNKHPICFIYLMSSCATMLLLQIHRAVSMNYVKTMLYNNTITYGQICFSFRQCYVTNKGGISAFSVLIQ